jgi:hypothetical protein
MRFRFRQFPALALAMISWSGTGQNSPAEPSFLPPASLRQLARNSGYIFDGTVLSVRPVTQTEAGLATVQITFRVEQGIRGTSAGQVLTIREWAGLWNAGDRYRPGERLLLFLYSPSKLGLTSPVGGPLGRFALDSGGNALLENALLRGLSLDPALEIQRRGKRLVNARALALAIQREQPD